jgi:ABC-type glycerol-3-phosphate transport system substrate-binding protein
MTRSLAIAAAAILVVVLSYGLIRSLTISARRTGDDAIITLRLAHWNLHAGQREAYDALIAEYAQIRPDVKVLQLPVPVRAWPAWQQTQLIGGTAPDIMQIGPNRGATDETIARHFLPLNSDVRSPNHYNIGTNLEGYPWRNTFFDGLTSSWVFFASLQEIYGVPTQLMSLRFYYNTELLRLVTGSDQPPTNFEEFLALHQATREFDAQHGRSVLTVAGSGDYGAFLTAQIISAHTSELRLKLDRRFSRSTDPFIYQMAYLDGSWDLTNQEIHNALEVARAFGEAMPPGFLQLRREDAALAFTQGRAVAMISGSWDYALLEKECPFPLVVTQLPILHAGMEPVSEAGDQLNAIYGITRYSKHPEAALDFLKFITSREPAARFAARTQNLPATIGIPIQDKNLSIFTPIESPRLPGLSLQFGPSCTAWFQTRAHLLFARETTTDHFLATSAAAHRAAALDDLSNHRSRLLRASQRDDTVLLALSFQSDQQTRFEQVATSHLLRETDLLRLQTALRE